MNSLQFGEYTLDRAHRQLRRGDQPVALPGKAFDLLVYMAQHPGRPLTKTELLGAVWPDSFVEESNLTQNVFLLRKALAPETPIVTLSGRGYQFAAQVSELAVAAPAVDQPAAPPAETPVATLAATHDRLVYEEQVEERIAIWRSPLAMAALALGLAGLVAAAWLGWQRYEDRVGGPPVQIVMADVDGGTGDPVLDRTIKDVLRIELAQSPFVTVVSGGIMRQTLTQMMRKPDDPVPLATAREICERTGSQAVVQEHVARVGSGFLVAEEATNCADNSSLAAVQKQVSKAEELPRAIDRMADDLRHSLGESRRTIARFNAPLSPVSTSSLEALKDYSQTAPLAQHAKFPECIELLKQAVALDPNFASAWLDLSGYESNALNPDEGKVYLQKAYDVRQYATEPTRLLIVARYNTYITGDLYESERNYKAWIRTYPRQVPPWSGLTAVYRELGRNTDLLTAAKRTLELAPTQGVAYQALADAQMRNGDFAGSRQTLELAMRKGYDGENIRYLLLHLGYLQHDAALVAEQEAWAKAHPDSPILLANLAAYAQNQGRMQEADRLYDQMQEAFTHLGQPGAATRIRQGLAEAWIELGETERGRKHLHEAPVAPELDNLLALAELGEISAADEIVKTQLAAQPHNTAWQEFYAPAYRAEVAMLGNRPTDAIALLEKSRAYDLRSADLMYLRGKAYLQAGDPTRAEAEFRRLLANPGVEANAYQLPMVQLWLARTLVKAGNKPAAAEAYAAFLAQWKNADAASPLLAAVKKEALEVTARP